MLYLNTPPKPFVPEDLAGQLLWAPFEPAEPLQAAMMRVLTDRQPVSIDILAKKHVEAGITLDYVSLKPVKVLATLRVIPQPVRMLTDRQREICRHLAAGFQSKQIATRIECTRATVDNHRAHIAEAIGIGRRELSAWAGEHREWL